MTPTPWRPRARHSQEFTESGLTLIELLIVTLVLPLVVGAITFGLFSIFTLQGTVAGRVSGSADAQEVSANFDNDIQGAGMIIAPPTGAPLGQSPATCGTSGTEVLSLESGTPTGTTYPTETSYVVVQQGSSSTYSLVRNVCQSGSSTPTSSTTISFNVPSGQTASVSCESTLAAAVTSGTGSKVLSVASLPLAVASGDTLVVGSVGTTENYTATAATAANTGATTLTATPVGSSPAFPIGTPVVDSGWATTNCGAAAGWVATTDVTNVTLAITEQNSASAGGNYSYTLAATPQANGSYSQTTALATPPTTSCNFATAGTGTYAKSLCFIDFAQWNTQSTSSCGSGGRLISASVTGTAFVVQLCLSVSSVNSGGGALTGWTTPWAYNNCQITGYNGISACPMPTDAGAWLGNYGYLGVPGDPALFTDDQGSSSTVTITGVQVFDGNGNPATGWDLVTADAESTTLSEYIEWKTTATSGLPPNLYLLPNSPTSPVGDACDSTPPTYNALFLTGVGTSTVVCNVNRSVIMTGTTMLAAAQPTGLTSSFGGGGLQGTVVGLLLQA